MKIEETFKTAVRALNSNKLRSFLTILGVIIGVFAVVAMIALGRGLQNYITDQFNELGSNLLFVVPGNIDDTGFGQRDPSAFYSTNKLEEKHVDLIRTNLSEYGIKVTPHISISERVEYKTNSYLSQIEAVNYQSGDIFNYEINNGRYFSRLEEKTSSRVAVLGPLVVEELFPTKDPIGQSVEIGDERFEVIGTFKEKGKSFDQGCTIPYTTAKEVFGVDNISDITVKVQNSDDFEVVKRGINVTLRRDLSEEDFSIMSQEDILSSINEILQMLTIGLGAIAAVSLLVGGIGIMNIMFVSVTERTKEIGLRKAVGATPKVIGIQFLMESTLLSLGGGMVGLAFGYIASGLSRKYIGLRTEIPWWAILLAFGFSALVGVVFGTYPAVQASKKDPIESLRYE